jgi:hypothetical protein
MNLKSCFSRNALSQNQPSTVADGVEGLYNTMKVLEARLGLSGVLFAAWNPSVFTLAIGSSVGGADREFTAFEPDATRA